MNLTKQEKSLSKQRRYQLRNASLGLCVRCGQPCDKRRDGLLYSICLICRHKQRITYNRKKRKS